MLLFVPFSAVSGAGKARRSTRVPARLALVAVFATLTALQPAFARWFDPEPRHRQHHYRHTPSVSRAEEKAEPVKQPSGLLYAVVSIADQHVTFYDANGVWSQSIVSTGVQGHPTPTGVFTILEKERWHHSNIYSGAPMPFMERITWTGVAMHEGVVTGHPASHGCIRLPGDFARKLFGVTVPGERVIISSQEVLPADIAHPHLPVPKMLTPPSELLDGSKNAKGVEPVALNTPAAQPPAAAALLNPLDFAKALKSAAEAKAKSAAQTKKQAAAKLDAKSQELRVTARDAAGAEDAVRRARSEFDEAARATEKAQGDDAVKLAAERKSAAETKLAEAERKLQAARDAQSASEAEIRSLETAIRDADAATVSSAAETKEAARRIEPLSIFISRKTGKLYVRQATLHLLEAPITIRDPDRPLGTHLFIATKARDDGASLRWVSLTPPAAAEVIRRHHSSRRGHPVSPEEETAPAAPFPETAAAALDRIVISQETAEAISRLLWTGATLIVSDVGMSGEGKFAMDFQILTHTVIHEY
jgi:lipoprotein-anchoring transpeptidase ErfK/SrfK